MKTISVLGLMLLGANASALWVIAWKLPPPEFFNRAISVAINHSEPIEIKDSVYVQSTYNPPHPFRVEIESRYEPELKEWQPLKVEAAPLYDLVNKQYVPFHVEVAPSSEKDAEPLKVEIQKP